MHVIHFWCGFDVAGFVWRSLNSIFISFTLHTPLFTSHFSSFCPGMTVPTSVRNTASFFCSNMFSTVWFVQFVKIDKSLPYWNWYTIFCIPVLSTAFVLLGHFSYTWSTIEKVSTCNICKWDGHNHHEAQWRAADQLHWVSTKLASNPWQFLALT